MKKALITGANSLVNKVLMGKLVRRGYKVTAHYHTDNQIFSAIKDEYPEVEYIQADFTKKEDVIEFVKSAGKSGSYDVIVNGAVVYFESGEDWQSKQREWDTWTNSFSVNTIVPGILMARADLLMNDGGVIINITSVAGKLHFAHPQWAVYGATKSALDLLTEGFAKQLAPRIRVVSIAPAYIRSAWNAGMDKDTLREVLKDHLTRKLVEPNDIANLMESVIDNPSINATSILIDGGYLAPR